MRKISIGLSLFSLLLFTAAAAWAQPPLLPWDQVARYLPPEVVSQIEADGGALGVIDLTLAGERGYLKYQRPAGPGREARPISREVFLRQVGEAIQVRQSGPRSNPKDGGRYWSLGFPKTRQGNLVLVVPGHGSNNVYLPLRVLSWPPRPEGRRDVIRFRD